MRGVLSLIRQGLRRRWQRNARVVDDSALGGKADAGVTMAVGAAAVPSMLARAVLAMECAIGLGADNVCVTEEASAGSGWRPRADEVSHLMVRECMPCAIYA